MRDVSEVHERLFREGNSDTKFGAFRTKFWKETKMAGIAKSTIANVHVEALRRGAFLRNELLLAFSVNKNKRPHTSFKNQNVP